jgi:hypothetical protein
MVKKLFMSNRAAEMVQHGKRIPAASMAAAEQICKLLRWIRKEDYLDSYLCLPGWGDIDHLSPGSSFFRRLETLSRLQRHRHFRSETLEVVTAGGGNPYERAESLFGDMEQNSGEKELFETLTSWSTAIISDTEIYLKEITPAREDDLAHYCIVRVSQCREVSRLFSITVDFHGELDTEQRLAILFTLEESLRSCAELLLLDRGVSNYIALRPLLSSSVWKPSWSEYFLHHKSWELLKDPEVLPLLFKRRHIIGSFFILHADENRAVFCKFVKDNAAQTNDMVMYQVLQRQDGIYVDIHMEACRAVFHLFRSKSFPLYALYERVRRRDEDCARNLRSRTNLLAELDSSNGMQNACGSQQQEEDVTRIMKVSTPTITQMRFFSEGSGSANDILSNLIARHVTSDSFQTQTARLLVEKADGHEGIFFIMRLDWYVLSVACLEFRDRTESEDEVRESYRDLTFYTAGIIDLYQSDDETKLVDDGNASGEQFSEALPIDEIMAVHPKLYAIALYEALRNDDIPVTSIRSDEVSYAMSVFSFREVLHASIILDDLTEQLPVDVETSTGQRLADLIVTILTPVPGSDDTVFYYHGKAGSDVDCSGKAEVHTAITESNDLEQFFEDTYPLCEDFSHADNQSIVTEGEKADAQSDSDCSPLYFQFTIASMGDVEEDDTPVSLKDIRALKRSAILTAQVSVFEHLEEKTLPLMHAHVIRKLQHALNEFASEQTLDKYRYLGSECLTTEDFKIVMRNLSQSKHRVLKIPITFYVSRSSSMIKASDPTGVNESDLDHGYHTLLSEFDISKFTIKSSVDSFLVVDDASSKILPYWCFVQVKKSSGSVIVRVHHPLGNEAAQERAETTVTLVKKMLDRTNQKLLLESMYKTRKAPTELFADREVDESRAAAATHEEPSPPVSNRGMYACPVQYQHEFPLHRRVSPSQAVRTLHSSILQNFMLSNRNGISVYRDESNNIYYMNLIYRKSIRQDDEENSHVIELLVYGIEQPGPVITEELVRLLQRKLLMLPLDALSSVLNKNPQYNLLATDMSFINNFSRRLKEIEPEIESNNNGCLRTYELPSHVEDPLTLLLMFRQNICGSTFIQRLHYESNEVDMQLSDMMEVNAEDGSIILNGLPGNEFCFFFNSLGLGLDPAAQHVTTLTAQGRIYSRQAGSGIAVIQVSLLHGSSSADHICVGKGDTMLETTLGVSKEYISLNPAADESKGTYKLVVKVTNTTVDLEAIQKWVNLSLCQVLAAYTIERHRESCSRSSSSTVPVCTSLAKGNREALNQLIPGLPPLEDMMTITIDLPHPAMMKIQSKTRLQATSLAVLTLDLTEKAVLSAIFNKSTRLPCDGVEIFRMANTASRVSVTRDRILKAKVVSFENGRVIKDNHVDSPEYICVFGLRQSDGNPINSPQHLFFKEIHVPRPETSVFTEVLHRIRSLKPALFELHMVFILRVSRNSRSLITYNVSPQIWAAMKTNFNDIEGELSRADEARRENSVGRCMEQFPFMTKKQQVAAASNVVKAAEPQAPKKKQPPKEESVVDKGPVRRIKRPTSMLRPKLIGKSVDGAAAQAVQASRLRAKTRPSVPQRTGAVSKLASPTPSNQKKQLKDKPAQQKQRKETAQKDTVGRSIVQSAVVPASNLLKFYRDLTALLKEASESHLVELMLSQSSLQYVTHAYFASMKERQSPFMFTRLISNCYGSPIGCGSIRHLQCDNDLPSIKTFLQFVTARWRANVIQSPYPQFVYLQKDLLISQRRRVSIMIEILMAWDRFEKCYIFHYKAWLINSSDNSKNPMQLTRAHAEQEAAAIDAISLNFMGQLTLDSQVLNFAGSRLTRAARKQDRRLNTLALLRCTFERFSEQVQSDYCLEGSADYMLQRRFLAPSSFLSKELIENYDRTELFQQFSTDGKAYKLNDCRGAGEKVFACGMLTIAGFSCHVFIAAHETVDSALEVFTLCVTRGKRVDTYVAFEGSLFAERICDVVLEYSMTAVEEIITAAAIKMRNVHLWRRFGSEFASTPAVSEVLMDELRQCCHCIDLMDIEPRLRVLLTEESNELQMPWDEIFKSFDRSPLFHCIRFDKGEETNWVVYSRENDIFVDITSESSSSLAQKRFRRVQLLMNDNVREQNTAKNASEQFVSFILNWVWDDCWLGI